MKGTHPQLYLLSAAGLSVLHHSLICLPAFVILLLSSPLLSRLSFGVCVIKTSLYGSFSVFWEGAS